MSITESTNVGGGEKGAHISSSMGRWGVWFFSRYILPPSQILFVLMTRLSGYTSSDMYLCLDIYYVSCLGDSSPRYATEPVKKSKSVRIIHFGQNSHRMDIIMKDLEVNSNAADS